jgi:hypothetical protein
VSIDILNAQKDQLGFPNLIFSNLKSSGIGNIEPVLVDSTFLELHANNSLFGREITLEVFLNISINDFLEVHLEELQWDFNIDAFAFSTLKFDFDTVSITFVYASSPSYNQFLINTTGQLKIIDDLTDRIQLPVSSIANLSNVTVPTILRTIEWNVYLPEPYDFQARFSKISLVTHPANSLYFVNDLVYSTMSPDIISVADNESLFIELENYTSGIIEMNRLFSTQASFAGYLYFSSENLRINVSHPFINPDPLFEYKLTFPAGFSDIQVKLDLSHQISIFDAEALITINEFKDSANIKMEAKLSQSEYSDVTFNDALQGKIWKFTSNRLVNLAGSFIVDQDFSHIHDMNTSNNAGTGIIPSKWPKGSFQLFIWFSDGYFSVIPIQLHLSPVEIVTSTIIVLHPAIKRLVPIQLRNSTSKELVIASKIYTYQESKLRSIDDSHGIVFTPGEFPVGNHLLTVNATKTGFVPFVFTMTIIVEELNSPIEFNIARETETKASINIFMPEYEFWTAPSSFLIFGEGINYSQEIRNVREEIILANEDWKHDLEVELTFELIIGNHITSQKIPISIPKWTKGTTPRNDSGSNLISSLAVFGSISVMSGISILAIKRLRIAQRNQRFSF